MQHPCYSQLVWYEHTFKGQILFKVNTVVDITDKKKTIIKKHILSIFNNNKAVITNIGIERENSSQVLLIKYT